MAPVALSAAPRGPPAHLVEVDDARLVAHLGGLVVGAPDRREGDLRVGRPHRDAQRGGGRALGVGGRVGIAHHQALALQDDGLRLVLRPRRGAAQRQGQEHGGQQPPAHGPHPRPLRAPLRAPRTAALSAGSSGSRSARASQQRRSESLLSAGFFPLPLSLFFSSPSSLLLLPPATAWCLFFFPFYFLLFIYPGPFATRHQKQPNKINTFRSTLFSPPLHIKKESKEGRGR